MQAQGAAQATEDAATLAAALRHCDNISQALQVYERQRRPRAAYVARNTRVLQQWWHLHDGPERERRDQLMKHDNQNNPMFWGYSERRDWLFGHDATRLINLHENIEIPELPPMPDLSASVYEKSVKAQDDRTTLTLKL